MDTIVIGTAGHIDHGKSALVEALTGTDPDRLKEEKARGITIDLGFAHFEEGGIDFALVDVPGHERFVKNMLAGATGIDGVLLVVAADESVMPQTHEHFDICRLLRVPAGVVALTRADLVDAETREIVRLEVQELVAGTFLADAPIVTVSAKTGEGLSALRAALVELAQRAGSATRRPRRGAVRLPIDRVFTVRGFGTVITGTLVAGEIRENDELQVLPAGRLVKVRGVQVHGRSTPTARAPRRTAVNLGGVEVSDLARGDAVATPGSLETTRRLDALFELLPSARPLRHGARVRVHQGTSELLGRVALSGPREEGREEVSDAAMSLQQIQPGCEAYVRIRLESPAVLTRGDRFVVRAYSPPITIGGGVVLDPQPPRGAIRTTAGRRRFRRLDVTARSLIEAEDEAAALWIEERGVAGLPVTALVSRASVSPEDVEATVERLVVSGRAVGVAEVLIAPDALEEGQRRLVETVHQHHRAEPLSEGASREELRERLFGRAHPAVFDHVLATLVATGTLVARDRLALASHRVALSAEEAQARDVIERVFREAGLKPPDMPALVAATRLAQPLAERIVALLVRRKVLTKLDALLFHTASLERLKVEVAALKGPGREPVRLDVPAFKAHYGITRKFAIPLLEYLDRERVTRRVGETRLVI